MKINSKVTKQLKFIKCKCLVPFILDFIISWFPFSKLGIITAFGKHWFNRAAIMEVFLLLYRWGVRWYSFELNLFILFKYKMATNKRMYVMFWIKSDWLNGLPFKLSWIPWWRKFTQSLQNWNTVEIQKNQTLMSRNVQLW